MPHIERNGQRIHYTVHGSGPPILMAHSFLCSWRMWEPQIEALKDRYTLVCVDARGHGESGNIGAPFTMWDAAEDHFAVLDELGHDRVIWAGLSQGGMAGLRAALGHPERISALILLDTDAGPETRFVKTKYTFMKLAARAVGIRPLLPAVGPIMFGKTTLRTQRELVNTWKERFADLHVGSMLFGIDAVRFRDDLRGRLGEIQQPCLVLVGSEDKALEPRRARALHACLVDSRYVEVPNCGHLSTQEAPEAVTSAMEGFLSAV